MNPVSSKTRYVSAKEGKVEGLFTLASLCCENVHQSNVFLSCSFCFRFQFVFLDAGAIDQKRENCFCGKLSTRKLFLFVAPHELIYRAISVSRLYRASFQVQVFAEL